MSAFSLSRSIKVFVLLTIFQTKQTLTPLMRLDIFSFFNFPSLAIDKITIQYSDLTYSIIFIFSITNKVLI